MNFDPQKAGDTYLYCRDRLQLCTIDPDVDNIEVSLDIWSKHLQTGLTLCIRELGINPSEIMPSA